MRRSLLSFSKSIPTQRTILINSEVQFYKKYAGFPKLDANIIRNYFYVEYISPNLLFAQKFNCDTTAK